MQTEKQKIFFSNKNYYLLFNILRKDIKKKFNFSIQDGDNIYKRELFKNMNLVFTKNSTKKIIDINKEVLKKTGYSYLSLIRKNNSQKNAIIKNTIVNNSSSISYDREMDMKKKIPPFVNLRPDSVVNLKEKLDVNKQYSVLTEKREENKNINTNNLEMFKDKKVINEKPTEYLLKQKMKERKIYESNQSYEKSIEAFKNNMEKNNLQHIKAFSEKENKKNNINENIFLSKQDNKSFVNQIDGEISSLENRNLDNANFIRNNSNIDRTKILRDNFIKDTQDNSYSNQFQPLVNEKKEIVKSSFSKSEKTHLLEISSLNRNWVNYPNLKENEKEHRFDFVIDFAPSINSNVKIPIYRNNPFTLKSLTEQNISIDNIKPDTIIESSDIIKNDKYKSNEPAGEIVNYIYKKTYGSQNASITERFRNISEIELLQVSLPFEYKFNRIESEHNNISTLFSYPFILLQIDEFNGIYNSTDNLVNKCFCRLIPAKEIDQESYASNLHKKTEARIKFLIMKPDTNSHKLVFSQSSLASLNRLSLRLTSPTGENIGSSLSDSYNVPKDNFNVISIELSENKKKLIITTDKYFYPSLFIRNDILLFKELEIRRDIIKCSKILNFLNRSSGHLLLNRGGENEEGYCQKLEILTEGSFDDTEGKWKPSDWVESFQNLNLESIITGKVINMSKQVSFLFRIKTIENNISKIESEIV